MPVRHRLGQLASQGAALQEFSDQPEACADVRPHLSTKLGYLFFHSMFDVHLSKWLSAYSNIKRIRLDSETVAASIKRFNPDGCCGIIRFDRFSLMILTTI